MRVLLLHGFNGSAKKIITRGSSLWGAMEKEKWDIMACDAPFIERNENSRTWWKDAACYDGLLESLRMISQKKSPDLIVGFSQGAILTSIICGLNNATDPHWKEHQQYAESITKETQGVILISGFQPRYKKLREELYRPDIITLPSLHIIGEKDTIVPPSDSIKLSSQFKKPLVYKHEGAHDIPKGHNDQIMQLIIKCLLPYKKKGKPERCTRKGRCQEHSLSPPSAMQSGLAVRRLISEDLEVIAQKFREKYEILVGRVEKANVLVAGVTGAGKSSIVNAIFGSTISEVGHCIPVTHHFTKIEPPNRGVVIYDSKGLEDGFHKEFIADTKAFFDGMRAKPQVKDHIHAIWYVVNCACARFEPFEAQLVREVFAPTPVIFILNKADIASPEQLQALENLIASQQLENNKGMFRTVANRQNYSQSWCPSCHSDDVMFKKRSKQLQCENCQHIETLTAKLNLHRVISRTTSLLPDLAKEAFLFSQIESLQEKDIRAKQIVWEYATTINMDVSGDALSEVCDMVSHLFVLWGWKFLGVKVQNSLFHEMKEEYRSQDVATRFAMIAADTIVKRKLSHSVIACLGILVNRPLRHLSEHLLTMIDEDKDLCIEELDLAGTESEDFTEDFISFAFQEGLHAAITSYWFELPKMAADSA